jgi:hypothetical protein
MSDMISLSSDTGLELPEYRELVSLFSKVTETDLASLEFAAAGKDWESMRQILHHVRGAALNLSLEGIFHDLFLINGADLVDDPGAAEKAVHSLRLGLVKLRQLLTA